MATLGVPYTLMYQSRGNSGLTNIVAFVRKPDNSVAGAFLMTEGAGAFLGCYFTDFYSSTTDPEGQYFARIFSPSEGGITDSVRFELIKEGSGSATIVLPPTSNLKARVMNDKVVASLEPDRPLTARIELEETIGVRGGH